LRKFRSLRYIKIKYSSRCHLPTSGDIATQLDFLKECDSRKLVLSGLLGMRSILPNFDSMSVSKRLELVELEIINDIELNIVGGYKQAIKNLIMLPNIRKSICFLVYSREKESKLNELLKDDVIRDFKRISGKEIRVLAPYRYDGSN